MKIDHNKKASLRWEIALSGVKEQPSARLMIKPTNMPYHICIPASVNGGIIEAKLTKDIMNTFEFNEAQMSLEVIVGESIFVPWKESLIIEEKFQLVVKPLIEEIVEDQKTTVTASVVLQIDEINESTDEITDESTDELIDEPIIEKKVETKTKPKGDTELDDDAVVVDKAPDKKDDEYIADKPMPKAKDKPKEKGPKLKPKDYLMSMLSHDDKDGNTNE